MAYQILWSDSAMERITEFLDFIAEENPAAAQRVIDDLFRRVEVLSEHPRLGRPLSGDVFPDLHRLIAGNYVVVYQIQEARQIINVVAVRHSRQRSLREEES